MTPDPHPWPLRMVALLLVLQAAGILLVAYGIAQQAAAADPATGSVVEALSRYHIRALTTLPPEGRQAALAAAVLLALGVVAGLALLAALVFALRWRFGWTLAMMTQIAALSAGLALDRAFDLQTLPPLGIRVCLGACTTSHVSLAHALLLGGVILVPYLNLSEVRGAFFATTAPPSATAAVSARPQ